jgi:hypothetical protein
LIPIRIIPQRYPISDIVICTFRPRTFSSPLRAAAASNRSSGAICTGRDGQRLRAAVTARPRMALTLIVRAENGRHEFQSCQRPR